MIQTKTVLVLGAGASMHYGFPSGIHLRQKILNNLSKSDNKPDKTPVGQLLRLFRTNHPCGESAGYEYIANFRRDLKESGVESIDEFLQPRSEEDRFLGQLAIAQALIPCERQDALYMKDTVDDGEISKWQADDWYQILIRCMLQDVPFKEFGKRNDISFITFNYDRSLEHYLFNSLKRRFNREDDEVTEVLNPLPVVHVHGTLGYLPWQGTPSNLHRPYRLVEVENESIIHMAATNIRIIHEADEKMEDGFDQAHDLLNTAHTIYFLGFGYNQINLDRLRIADLDKTDKKIMGTAKGVSTPVKGEISARTNDVIDQHQLLDLSIVEFFTNRVILK